MVLLVNAKVVDCIMYVHSLLQPCFLYIYWPYRALDPNQDLWKSEINSGAHILVVCVSFVYLCKGVRQKYRQHDSSLHVSDKEGL